jgi:hypothetical protein
VVVAVVVVGDAGIATVIAATAEADVTDTRSA